MDFVPCSPRHRHCSRAHAEMVRSYWLARYSDELKLEDDTGMYRGDIAHALDMGYKMITFRDWLKCSARERYSS